MDDTLPDLNDVPTLTTQEVAASTGLSYHAVLRAVHRGEVVAYKLCGRVRFRKADVLDWVERSRVELEEEWEQPKRSATAPPPAPGSREALRALVRRLGA